jgi:hypothetical protein
MARLDPRFRGDATHAPLIVMARLDRATQQPRVRAA